MICTNNQNVYTKIPNYVWETVIKNAGLMQILWIPEENLRETAVFAAKHF